VFRFHFYRGTRPPVPLNPTPFLDKSEVKPKKPF
jgi:hypothetical protein